jgi:CubicO group peptidase (beta-lactamase class C family)
MKKVLASLILVASAVSANAQMIHGHGWVGPDHYRHHGHGGGYNWVVPAVIGGAVVYAATRPPVVVQQQPVIVQQAPSDVVYIEGVAYRKQVMVINGQYQEVLVRM